MQIMGLSCVTKSILQSLALIIILIILPSGKDFVSASTPRFLQYECPRSNFSYSSGSTFEANLNHTLLDVLPVNVLVNGSSQFIAGRGTTDQIYALCYCRGDVSAQDCHDCVQAAAGTLLQRCRPLKEAIAWYEECTLRYSNRSIFSLEEEVPLYRYYNFSSILSNLDQHQQVFDDTMNGLIRQTAFGSEDGKLHGFATAEAELSQSWLTLRGLMQCSPDIVRNSCEKCLSSALKQMDGWATTMIFLPSCNLRFDLYQSTPPTDSGQSNGHSVRVLALALLLGFLLLCCIFLLVLLFRHRPHRHEEQGNRRLKRFKHWQLKWATRYFSKKLELGGGGFGTVYKGRLFGGKVVAIKKFHSRRPNEGDDGFDIELETINLINHPNVVSLYGYCIRNHQKMLVYEYVPNGTLHHHLHRNGTTVLSWEKRMQITIGLANAMAYLYKGVTLPGRPRRHAVIHRDIKPTNILIDDDFEPKIGDFGLAKLCRETRSHMTTIVKGTHGFLDPYYFTHEVLTRESDVFAFGIVLLELISGRRANDKENGHILNWVEPLIREAMSDQANDLSFRALVDPRLENRYDHHQLDCVMTCAAICARPVPTERPNMSKVLKALEGWDVGTFRTDLQRFWQIGVSNGFMSTMQNTNEITGSSSSPSEQNVEARAFSTPSNIVQNIMEQNVEPQEFLTPPSTQSRM